MATSPDKPDRWRWRPKPHMPWRTVEIVRTPQRTLAFADRSVLKCLGAHDMRTPWIGEFVFDEAMQENDDDE